MPKPLKQTMRTRRKKAISDCDLRAAKRHYSDGGIPDCWVPIVGGLIAEVYSLRKALRELEKQHATQS